LNRFISPVTVPSMDTKTDSSPVPIELTLVRGGLFYRIERAVGLIRANQWNLGRRIIALIAVTWLPLVLITAAVNWGGLPSLFTDDRVNSRLLVAIPVLLLGEPLMESRFRAVFAHIRSVGMLEAPDLAYMSRVISTLIRVRDSFLPELVILGLAILRTALAYNGSVDAIPWLGNGAGSDFHITAAGWYALAVSVTAYEFLFGLCLWKWLLWTFFAFKLSRRNLKLVATHPDQHGGLGFLGHTVLAFAPIAFSATAAIGGTWRHQMLDRGAHLLNFKLPAIALVLIIALLALGPEAFFMPRLAALRHTGMREYGALGQVSSSDFQAKWIHKADNQSEFLLSRDSTALHSFGQVYDQIKELKPFPADKEALYTLAAAIAIPALPVVLAEIPIATVLKDLLTALR